MWTALKNYKSKERIEWISQCVNRKKNIASLELCTQWNYPWRRQNKDFFLKEKQKLREYVASTPAVEEMLKEVCQKEEKLYGSGTCTNIKKGRALKNE